MYKYFYLHNTYISVHILPAIIALIIQYNEIAFRAREHNSWR